MKTLGWLILAGIAFWWYESQSASAAVLPSTANTVQDGYNTGPSGLVTAPGSNIVSGLSVAPGGISYQEVYCTPLVHTQQGIEQRFKELSAQFGKVCSGFDWKAVTGGACDFSGCACLGDTPGRRSSN
jgi:hypothetical protein